MVPQLAVLSPSWSSCISTILAIVNRNMPPESKVTWLLIAVVPVFGSLLYLMFGERRLSKKEMKQLENMESMEFREDNSRELHLKLKKEKTRRSTAWSSPCFLWTTMQTFTMGQARPFPSGRSDV